MPYPIAFIAYASLDVEAESDKSWIEEFTNVLTPGEPQSKPAWATNFGRDRYSRVPAQPAQGFQAGPAPGVAVADNVGLDCPRGS